MRERRVWIRPERGQKPMPAAGHTLIRVIIELVPVALLAAILVASISIALWLAPDGVSLTEAVDFDDLYFFLIQSLPAIIPLLLFASIGFIARLRPNRWIARLYRACLIISLTIGVWIAFDVMLLLTSKSLAHGSWYESRLDFAIRHLTFRQIFELDDALARLGDTMGWAQQAARWLWLLATGIVLGWQVRRVFELRGPRDQQLRYRQLVLVTLMSSAFFGLGLAAGIPDRFGVGSVTIGYGAFGVDIPRSSVSVIGGGNLPGPCSCGAAVEWVGRRSIVLTCGKMKSILYAPQNVSIQTPSSIDRIAADYRYPERPILIHKAYWRTVLETDDLSLSDICRDGRISASRSNVESPLIVTRLGWRIDVSKSQPEFDYALNCTDGRLYVTGKSLTTSAFFRQGTSVSLSVMFDGKRGPEGDFGSPVLYPDIIVPVTIDGEQLEAGFGGAMYYPRRKSPDEPIPKGPFVYTLEEKGINGVTRQADFTLSASELGQIQNRACFLILGSYLLPVVDGRPDAGMFTERMLMHRDQLKARWRLDDMRSEVVKQMDRFDAARPSTPTP